LSMLLTVKMQMPGESAERSYEISEESLKTVVAWAGSAVETARLLGCKREKLQQQLQRYPCMKEMIANRYLLKAERALQGMEGAIVERDDLMRFWTRTMYDPSNNTTTQLSASVNLAKALGMFIERREVVTEDVTGVHKSVTERLDELQERKQEIAMYGEWTN